MLGHILKWINGQERTKERDTGDMPTCPVCGSIKIQYSNEYREYFCQAHKLRDEEIERIKAGYDSGVFRSLIIATTEPLENLPRSLVDRATTILELRAMTTDEAWSMIEQRLNGMPNPFQKESLDLIVRYANGNPRRILKTCELVLKELPVKYSDLPTYILPEHVSEILGINNNDEQVKVEEKTEKTSEEHEEYEIEDIDLGSDLLNSLSPLHLKISNASLNSSLYFRSLAGSSFPNLLQSLTNHTVLFKKLEFIWVFQL